LSEADRTTAARRGPAAPMTTQPRLSHLGLAITARGEATRTSGDARATVRAERAYENHPILTTWLNREPNWQTGLTMLAELNAARRVKDAIVWLESDHSTNPRLCLVADFYSASALVGCRSAYSRRVQRAGQYRLKTATAAALLNAAPTTSAKAASLT